MGWTRAAGRAGPLDHAVLCEDHLRPALLVRLPAGLHANRPDARERKPRSPENPPIHPKPLLPLGHKELARMSPEVPHHLPSPYTHPLAVGESSIILMATPFHSF